MAQNEQNTGLQIQIPGMDKFKDLKFLQSEASPTDLVVVMPDGSEVVFPGYIALIQAGAPPAITLEDGTVVPGDQIASLIDDLDFDLLAPAAGNDVVGPQTGGGAGFSDPQLDPDDDIGHGPYANRIEIADEVGVDQFRGYTSEDGDGDGGGGDVPSLSRINNVGDTYSLMDQTRVDLGDRPASSGPLSIELTTIAPEPNPVFQMLGIQVDDWDGMRVELQAGETITINHHARNGAALDDYWIALETDNNAGTGSDPLVNTGYPQMGWTYLNFDGSISYTSDAGGVFYVGTGFPDGTNYGDFFTEVLIDSDNIHTGTDDDDILVGGSNAEVFIGGAGDDQLTGNGGSDQFRFESELDGHDEITDFLVGAGGDVINLDALFDAIAPPSGLTEAQRLNSISIDGAGKMEIDIGGGTIATFSVTSTSLIGETALTLDGTGNLVVDQS